MISESRHSFPVDYREFNSTGIYQSRARSRDKQSECAYHTCLKKKISYTALVHTNTKYTCQCCHRAYVIEDFDCQQEFCIHSKKVTVKSTLVQDQAQQ